MDGISGGPFARGLIVVNPAAGTVTDALVAELDRLCRGRLDGLRVCRTSAAGHARTLVRDAVSAPADERPDVVVAVGGDGTVREVVTGLLAAGDPAPPPLLVVPAGTGNSNYLAQWGQRPWQKAVTAALTGVGGRIRRLDLARLVERDELVLLGACSGIVAQALVLARDLPHRGPARYQAAFTEAARTGKAYPGRVTVDGVVVHDGPTMLANVGGGRYRGGTYKLLPHSVLDDGLLDVCVIGDELDQTRIPDLIRTGRHVREPGVVYARGRRVTVERTDGEPLWFEHDGELLAGVSPIFTLQVIAGALPVLCRSDRTGG